MKSSSSVHFTRLDHLRFVAAALVIFWHSLRFSSQAPTDHVSRFWLVSVLQEGHTGVALFMTLSGFLFWTLCSGREVNYGVFIRNRFVRIFPLFAMWMLFYVFTGGVDPVKLVTAVLLLVNDGNAVPGNGWAVVVEFQFYLVFPFLLVFQRKYGIRYLWGLLAFFIGFRAVAWYGLGTVQSLAYSTILGRMDQFLIGMLCAELAARRPTLFRGGLQFPLALVVWSGTMYLFDLAGGYFDGPGGVPSSSSIWVAWPTIEGLLYAAIIASYLGWSVRIPSRMDRMLAWLGTLSFSLYLNHALIITAAGKATTALGLNTQGVGAGLLFGAVAVLPAAVLLSAATYYLIELPFLSLRRPYLSAAAESANPT
jgi:peptidoglycan/LPS O-acetylase OafA/YrhL